MIQKNLKLIQTNKK